MLNQNDWFWKNNRIIHVDYVICETNNLFSTSIFKNLNNIGIIENGFYKNLNESRL